MAKHDRIAPRRRPGFQHIEGVTPRGGLFDAPEAAASAERVVASFQQRAIADVRLSPHLTKSGVRKGTATRLRNIAIDYWNEKRWTERSTPQQYRDSVLSLLTAAAAFAGSLKVTMGLGYALHTHWTDIDPAAFRIMRKVVAQLADYSEADIDYLPATPRGGGRPSNEHVTNAVMSISSLWKTLVPHGSVGYVVVEDGRFRGEGPRFVWNLMQAIDGSLLQQTVTSSLRKAGRAKT